ncbi:MAG: hypothetical protein ABIJ09_17615 [Pseudomonadota bacterium]
MKRFLTLSLVTLALAAVPADAHATPVVEDATLGALLAETIRQGLEVTATLAYIQQGVDYARQQAELVAAGLEAAESVAAAFDDPENFFQTEAENFQRAFPELDRIRSSAEGIRSTFTRDEDGRGRYNPYAFATVLRELKESRAGAFDMAIHTVDLWAVNEPFDRLRESLTETKNSTARMVRDTVLEIATGMRPERAAIISAQAGTITADNTTSMSLTLQELLRIQQVRLLNEVNSKVQIDVDYSNQMKATPEESLAPASWGLEVDVR